MHALYQGKIDNFCAMYAVLNAVQVLFGLSPLHARKIFNRAMMEQARDLENFQKILEHKQLLFFSLVKLVALVVLLSPYYPSFRVSHITSKRSTYPVNSDIKTCNFDTIFFS